MLTVIFEAVAVADVINSLVNRFRKKLDRKEVLRRGINRSKVLPLDPLVEMVRGPVHLTKIQKAIHNRFLISARYVVQTRAFELVTEKFYYDKFHSKGLIDRSTVRF